MTTAELNLTATYVTALASEPNATEKIKMLLQSLFASYGKGTDFPAQETPKVKDVSSIITFSWYSSTSNFLYSLFKIILSLTL